MPRDVEIDTPASGDAIGRMFPVTGTYDLGINGRPATPPQVICLLEDAAGNPAQTATGQTVAPVYASCPDPKGTFETNSFNLDRNYSGYKIIAILEFGSTPYPSYTVTNIDINDMNQGTGGVE